MSEITPIEYQLSHCRIKRWSENYLETIFEHGAKAAALFTYNHTSQARALELGYGEDVRSMHLEHEICHTILSEALGHPYSLTLYGVAHRPYHERWHEEEKMVLAFQKWTRTGAFDSALEPLLAEYVAGRAPFDPLPILHERLCAIVSALTFPTHV